MVVRVFFFFFLRSGTRFAEEEMVHVARARPTRQFQKQFVSLAIQRPLLLSLPLPKFLTIRPLACTSVENGPKYI